MPCTQKRHGNPLPPLFHRHVNITPLRGLLKDHSFHLIIKFPSNYPHSPPSISICHPISHPNIFPNGNICLDMLEASTSSPYSGWTAAYSLTSLLTQLQRYQCLLSPAQNKKRGAGVLRKIRVFLQRDPFFPSPLSLSTKLQAPNKQKNSLLYSQTLSQSKGTRKLKEKLATFKCSICGHNHEKPCPPLNKTRFKDSQTSKKKLTRAQKRRKRRKQAKKNQQTNPPSNSSLSKMTTNRKSDLGTSPKSPGRGQFGLIGLPGALQLNSSTSTASNKSNKVSLWEMLYSDVEKLIFSYLTLSDFLRVSRVNQHFQTMVDSTKILQMNRFTCWFHRITLSFDRSRRPPLSPPPSSPSLLSTSSKRVPKKAPSTARKDENLILGYGITPKFYGKSLFRRSRSFARNQSSGSNASYASHGSSPYSKLKPLMRHQSYQSNDGRGLPSTPGAFKSTISGGSTHSARSATQTDNFSLLFFCAPFTKTKMTLFCQQTGADSRTKTRTVWKAFFRPQRSKRRKGAQNGEKVKREFVQLLPGVQFGIMISLY